MSGPGWYYVGNGAQQGPVDLDSMGRLIAAGTIKPDTLVWSEGMAAWLPASQTAVAGMFGGGAAPSGFPATPAPPPAGYPYGGTLGAQTFGDPASGGPAPPRSFGDAIKVCLSKYVEFKGRASRSEYWWFALFGVLLSLLATGIDLTVFQSNSIQPLSSLVSLGMLLPSLGAGVRRLHDTDRSGWWYLIAFVPLVGIIILIVFLCQKPTPTANRFG